MEWYRDELHRRLDRQTRTMARLTWVMTVLTRANVILVAAALWE